MKIKEVPRNAKVRKGIWCVILSLIGVYLVADINDDTRVLWQSIEEGHVIIALWGICVVLAFAWTLFFLNLTYHGIEDAPGKLGMGLVVLWVIFWQMGYTGQKEYQILWARVPAWVFGLIGFPLLFWYEGRKIRNKDTLGIRRLYEEKLRERNSKKN